MLKNERYTSDLVNHGAFPACVISIHVKNNEFGKILYFNKQFADMVHASPESIIHSKLWKYQGKTDKIQLRDVIFKMVLENHFANHAYATFQLENGTSVHIKFHLRPNISNTNELSKPQELLIYCEEQALDEKGGVSTDTSKIKADYIHTSLVEMNHRLDSMLSTLGHELKNFVGGVVMLGGVIDKEIATFRKAITDAYAEPSITENPVAMQLFSKISNKLGKLSQLFSNIKNSSNKANIMLEDLSMHRLLYTGKQKMKLVFVDMEELITDLCKEIIPEFKKKGVVLKFKVPEQSAAFKADPKALHRVLHNLLTNSLKFTNKDGLVKISGELTSESATFTVIDNGIGINPKNISQLFDASNLVTTLGTEGEIGTGLGLPICYEIIAAHCGNIEIESAPTKGTKCIVRIPQPTKLSIIQDTTSLR